MIVKMVLVRLASFALALSPACFLQAEDRMKAGVWENTVTSDGFTVVKSHCVTAAEAETTNLPAKAMRESTEKAIAKSGAGKCTLKEFTVEGNKISHLMVCGPTSYASTTTYRVDAFETTSTSTTAGTAKVTLMKGRRIGLCPVEVVN